MHFCELIDWAAMQSVINIIFSSSQYDFISRLAINS
jgi:hypothetical protein